MQGQYCTVCGGVKTPPYKSAVTIGPPVHPYYTTQRKKRLPAEIPRAAARFLSCRGLCESDQTTPWLIIALAIFWKPAMFAPATRLPFMPYSSAAAAVFL